MSTTERKSIHGMWTSRVIFILAATGSAVGLGNIWKFPYMTGDSGGGIFVITYIACVFIIGVPIMMAEVLLGRRGRRNPIDTMRTIAIEEGLSAHWAWLGRIGLTAGFLILSYYSVVAGWILAYVFRMVGGIFQNMSPTEVESVFTDLVADPERLIAWHTIFIVVTVAIVSRGVEHGLEKAVKYMMPALFVILGLLLLYAASTSAFVDGMRFMFVPDFSKFTHGSILTAMGMAFFSLSLGMGAIMIYGSYLPKDASIAKMTIIVALADTTVALIAGMAIFPIVFSNGLEVAQGPGLVFTTLPVAFNQMPAGSTVGTLFFILLAFAAITSAISLLEPLVAWLVETKNMARAQAARICGTVAWVLGLGTVFSFNLWSDYKLSYDLDLGKVQYAVFKEKSFFDIADFLTSSILLPLGGLLIAVFVAHFMRRESCQDELKLNPTAFNIWYFILRNIAPIAVGVIFLHAIGVFHILGIAG